jgi:hypothetical protein
MKFEHEWHVLGFATPRPYNREQCEHVFATGLAFDADGATIH